MSAEPRGTNAQAVVDDGPVDAADLTHFQLSILGTLAEGPDYGLAIKRALEAYYGEGVNHGRFYPNADTLVEMGLVEKRALDQRTNEYELSDDGRALLEEWHAWFDARLAGGDGE